MESYIFQNTSIKMLVYDYPYSVYYSLYGFLNSIKNWSI